MGASVNKPFYDNLKSYCKKEGAELYICPIRGAYKNDVELDSTLINENIIYKNMNLNSNVKVMSYDVVPQQIDPLTGLIRFTQDDKTTILPATKIRMKPVPNSNKKIPKVLLTTGAITQPNYKDNRIGNIAKYDHKYGAVVVEVLNNKNYHYRHLSANKNGTFYDLGYRYDEKGKHKERPEVMVLGDWHTGVVDKKVRKATEDMIQLYKPKNVFIHDFFNADSINHHNEGKIIERYSTKDISLEKELGNLTKELQWFINTCSKDTNIYIVKSNHDEFLNRYLTEGRFVKDIQNVYLASKLLTASLEGKDPLKHFLETQMKLPNNVFLLDRDQDIKIRGYQLGNHGDLGANGSRNSLRTQEYANGKSIIGHSHSPEVFRNLYKVGTSTHLRLGYNRGYSNWMNTHAMLYKNSQVQLINIINGKYKISL